MPEPGQGEFGSGNAFLDRRACRKTYEKESDDFLRLERGLVEGVYNAERRAGSKEYRKFDAYKMRMAVIDEILAEREREAQSGKS